MTTPSASDAQTCLPLWCPSYMPCERATHPLMVLSDARAARMPRSPLHTTVAVTVSPTAQGGTSTGVACGVSCKAHLPGA